MRLIIGNQNYSSWSLRPWILLKQAGIPFRESKVWIHKKNSINEFQKFADAERVPILIDGNIQIWESLAIAEYIAEKFPGKNLWPKDKKARAFARSIASEMHSGFQNLRKHLPFNSRYRCRIDTFPEDLEDDIARIDHLWKESRKRFGKKGKFLFGAWSVSDAMYVPIVLRFRTYSIPLTGESAKYAETILSLAGVREWSEQAALEKESIPESEKAYQPV